MGSSSSSSASGVYSDIGVGSALSLSPTVTDGNGKEETAPPVTIRRRVKIVITARVTFFNCFIISGFLSIVKLSCI